MRSKTVHKKYIGSSTVIRSLGSLSDSLEDKNTLHYIYTILETLQPPLMAKAFKLVLIEGLTHKESALRLGITTQSSRTYVWKALKILKVFFKK